MGRYDRAWADRQLLGLDEPMPQVRALIPLACRTQGHERGGELAVGTAPGLYLKDFGNRGSGNPGIRVEFGALQMRHGGGRLLGQHEALVMAAFWDSVAAPYARSVCPLRDNDVEGFPIPGTFVTLIGEWYGALGRALGRAIDEAEDRRALLREARAAITGRAG